VVVVVLVVVKRKVFACGDSGGEVSAKGWAMCGLGRCQWRSGSGAVPVQLTGDGGGGCCVEGVIITINTCFYTAKNERR
jgi:hypothetical protein